MNILLVYPEFPDTFWSFKHALKFVHRKAATPPLGAITVASMLPVTWNKRLVDMNVRPLQDTDLIWADYVFISAMLVQRQSTLKVLSRCKFLGKKVVAGGPLFTNEYEFFPEVDHFVLNEAELTLPLFLADLEKGALQHVYATSEYADLQKTPLPEWSLLDLDAYDCMSLQITRGCPFNCDFCSVTALLGHQVRHKTVKQVLAELDSVYRLGWRRNILIVDDNFIGNKKFLKQELLPALIEWRKDKKTGPFITEVSINLADDDELIHLMVQAGFASLFIGIETPDEEALKECRKSQNRNRNLVESVHHLQRSGLQVYGGFIVGFDHDTPGTFQQQIDFIQRAGIVVAMVGLLQAPYGTQLYRRMQQEGRLAHLISGNNTDGDTNIVPKMDLQVLKNGYRHLMHRIYSPGLFYQRLHNFLQTYRPVNMVRRFEVQEILAILRSMWSMGILNRGRFEYWKLLGWCLLHAPRKFPAAITMSIYGFHLDKVSRLLEG